MNDLLSLQKIFNDTLFRIPDFQRGYSWSNQQLEEFWSDLISLLPNQDHYTGMISLKEVKSNIISNSVEKWNEEKWLVESGYTLYEVVDGQQRLTTLIILINEIVSYCKNANISEINNILLSEIEEKYLYKSKANNIIRTYKFGYEEDNPSYNYFRHVILNEQNNGKIEETFYTLNLSNAKRFFENKIEEIINKTNIKKLEEIFKKITLQLKFNMYYIVDDFNVFVAFETMNNRGKKLSYLELLKNRLIYLSTLFDNDEDEKTQVRYEINETWKEIYGYLGKNKNCPLSDDEFLQNHWMIYFGFNTRKIQGNQTIPYHTFLLNKYFIQQNINPINTYIPDLTNLVLNDENNNELESEDNNIVENVYDDKQIKLTLKDIRDYVKSLKELIPFWYSMYFPDNNYSIEIKKYLFRLKELGHVNSKPLITVLLSKKDFTDEQKINCLKHIERFNFMHYRLNSYLGTYSNSTFYNLARDLYYNSIKLNKILEKVTKIDYLSENNVINSSGIVEKFRRLFKRYGYYDWGTLKYLLYVYDVSKTTTQSERNINPDDYFKLDPRDNYSIEHIYPQKAVDEYWTERFNMYSEDDRKILSSSLGNMLPLSSRINSKLQNHSYTIKKTRFANGSISERIVASYGEWTPLTILNRGLEILSFMEKEWDFKFENLAQKKKILGLDFMIDEEDVLKEVNIPINDEEKNIKKVCFDEEQYKRLISNTNSELLDIYKELENYILSLDKNITKNTSSTYVSYNFHTNFSEVTFLTKKLKYVLEAGDYNDPKHYVERLPEDYKWKKNNCMYIDTDSDLEYAKFIFKQCFEKNLINSK